MSAIYKREMSAFFTTPIGYVFCAIFFALSGLIFSLFTVASQTTSTKGYFSSIIMTFVILIPLLTMKLLSEERKSKTEQILLTSPVSLVGIILAKFLAAFTIFAATLVSSCLINMAALYSIAKEQENVISKLNVPTVLASIFGVMLVGAVFISIGLFISSLTENQIVSAVLTIAALLLVIGGSLVSQLINNTVLRVIAKWFSVLDRFAFFYNGIFDFTAVIYFISLIVIFIFLTVRIYEKRRWE
jgi:ABC-2 type transport system permease protein